MTFKSLHGCSPDYINTLLKKSRNTRYEQNKLVIPSISSKRTGCKAFSYAAPFLWNALPREIRNAESTEAFKKQLKTYFFEKYFGQN